MIYWFEMFERTPYPLSSSSVVFNRPSVAGPALQTLVTLVASHMYIGIYINFVGQSLETSQWKVCYQWGLPRLVS